MYGDHLVSGFAKQPAAPHFFGVECLPVIEREDWHPSSIENVLDVVKRLLRLCGPEICRNCLCYYLRIRDVGACAANVEKGVILCCGVLV